MIDHIDVYICAYRTNVFSLDFVVIGHHVVVGHTHVMWQSKGHLGRNFLCHPVVVDGVLLNQSTDMRVSRDVRTVHVCGDIAFVNQPLKIVVN